MNALRQIIDQHGDDIHIHLPDEFRGHRLEVLVVPLDNDVDTLAVPSTRPKVGTITSSSLSCSSDAFAPLTADELRDWGL